MKKWLRIISLCLIFASVFACATFFTACDDDNSCGGPPITDTPDDEPDNTPNIDQLSYYTLPDSFYLRIENASGYVANFVKLNESFFIDSATGGENYSAQYLTKNTDGTFTNYLNKGEGWAIDSNLTLLDADKAAYIMFNLIIHKVSNYTDDIIMVNGENVLCDTYTNSRGKQYWLAKGYNFWIKNDNGFYATALNLSLTEFPDGFDLPVLQD